jgi:hypothetical protein
MIFGISLFVFSYLIAFFFPKEVRTSFLLVLTVHAAIILLYSFFPISFIGSTEDAQSFYNHAIEKSLLLNENGSFDSPINNQSLNWSISNLSNGVEFFKNFHTLLQYYFSGPEKLLSNSTTLLAWSFCSLLLGKIYLTISKDDFDGASILIYLFSLTPSILIFNSYLLREVWMSLMIYLIVFFAVTIKNYQKKILLIFLTGLVSILFHRYMILITASVLTIVLIYDAIIKYDWYPFNNVKLFSYLFILAIASIVIFNSNLEAISIFKDYGILGAIEKYSIGLAGGHGDGGPPARATYGVIFDKENIFSIFHLFLSYQLMPYPWRVTSIVDFLPIFENFLRLGLIILFFFQRTRLLPSQKMHVDMIFLIWLGVELIWSIGTINWGTAYRHHTVVFGLLVIASVASYRSNRFKIP